MGIKSLPWMARIPPSLSISKDGTVKLKQVWQGARVSVLCVCVGGWCVGVCVLGGACSFFSGLPQFCLGPVLSKEGTHLNQKWDAGHTLAAAPPRPLSSW